MNDKALRQSVVDALDFEPSIDAAHIGVAVEEGVITLTGHVSTYMQKIEAEKAVWRVRGVKAIAEELKVRLLSDAAVADDQIARRVIDILSWGTLIPKDAVQVVVRDGWVTLTGKVSWNYQRDAASRSVRKLAGVLGVVNNIVLAPPTKSVDINRHVLDALKRHAEVEAARIQVEVDANGAVRLSGTVDNWEERRAVERAVWSTPGVHTVIDDISIE